MCVKRLICTLVATLLLILPLAWGSPAEGQPEPIRIGLLAPLTGAAAGTGKDMRDGFLMYMDEIGYRAAGRRIEVIVEDTQGNPGIALTKATKLVQQDKVRTVTGALLASSCYALAPFLTREKIPYLSLCAADDLTQRTPTPYLIRTTWTSSQTTHPFGEWVVRNTKIRKVVTVGLDYAFGYEVIGGFQKTFEEAGGKVIQKIWPPLGTTDFGPYIAQIRRDADAIFTVFFGAFSLRFAKQFREAGLHGKMLVLGGGTTTDEHALPAMGDEALGYITSLHYSAALDNPVNRRFVAEYRKRFGKVPSYYSENLYTMARWIVEGIKALDGKVEDTEKFLAALRRVKFEDSPRGPVELDDRNNVIQNVYVRKVERVGGELQSSVITTIPQVTQFWKYKPEEFLAQPVYSRDYPPCRYCQ